MNWNSRTFAAYGLTLTALLSIATAARAQNSVPLAQPASAIVVLDSTKAQDGLNGSVRRVKTESARLELKQGQLAEGPRQLIEVTTYDLSGKRVENVSYPVASSSVGKEEYKYDGRGNIIEMTMRGDGGAILSRETYSYEFDRFGNWTKMVTSLVVFEADELKREPIEVTYRSLSYYFDDNVAKIVDAPAPRGTEAIQLPSASQVGSQGVDTLHQVASGALSPSVPLPGGNSATVQVEVGEPPLVANRTTAGEKVNSAVADASQLNQPADETPTQITGSSPIPFDSEPAKREAYISVNSTVPEAGATALPATPTSPDPGVNAATESRPAKVAPSEVSGEKQAFEFYKTGRDLFDSGDVKGAIGSYRQSLELAPNSAEVQLSLGQAYLQLKKDKDASKAFKDSLRLNPNAVEALYGLGLVDFRMGRHRDAANAFKRAIQISPELAKAHYGLALADQELQDVKGVIEEYRLLQRLDHTLAKQLERAFPVFDLPCQVASCK